MRIEVSVPISTAEVKDRLRTLQDRLTDDNEHDRAFLIGLSIKTIEALEQRIAELAK